MNDIDLHIDERVLRETTKCANNFRCLSGDKSCFCEGIYSIGSDMIKIPLNPDRLCAYRLSYGYSYFCLCPTRCEIYNRYKI